MPTNVILLAIAAGIMSAVVFASATAGAMLFRVLLFLLTPLSLYLAGLGLGTVAATIAAVTATITIFLIANPLAAEVYAISTAIPAVILTRLAQLSRGEDEDREWYPIGRLVVVAAAFAGVFASLAIILMGGDVDTLSKMLRTVVESFVKSDLARLPGAPEVTSQQIDEITQTTLSTLPWALGLLAMSTTLLNLWLAGRITLASGRLKRPWPDLAYFSMPPSATLVLLVATAVSFTGGLPGLLAGGIAAPFLLAFALVGLGVVHVLTRNSPWQIFILTALYTGALIIPHVGLLLALGGLAETIFHYRRAGPPPAAPH
ncbi:DUF2232 domain-containing protein [Hyphomicrobium methylovorum]|uniref:DUF2232 domain-containing protein n=1 Tax=Hyphomicrobium methylovorum TaxID=84 RepID=UPI0015E72513|nr:DUF2232 domain-containing protein [Hyphomicrobium methylovorum]MBA2127746.1 DUF2232 domain-containing protein [Hyphomicrobium methylovorum]